MQVTTEKLNPCTIKLSVVCETNDVAQGYERALKKISKSIRLPGFRPGHAPKAMVEGMVSKDQLNQEAADEIVRSTLTKVLKEESIEPFPGNRPSVSLEKLDVDSKECVYTAKIPLAPIVKLGEYKGLSLEKPKLEVTNEEIEYQIDDLRKRKSSRVPLTDRGVDAGDVAFVNIKPEGDQTGRNFMTSVGQTFPELDEAVKGLKVEEMKNVELTFPANFQEKDWAGKTKKVQLTLNSASAVKLPELDDEFAKSLNASDVTDLRTKVTETLEAAKESMGRDIMVEQIMEKLLAGSEVEVADNAWEDIANRRLQETATEQGQQGKSMETYASENGMTLEELVQAWQEKAKLYIKRAFLIREIFAAEQMQLTNQDLNQELVTMAYEFQVSPAEMFDVLKKNNSLEELQFRAISTKVSEFLLANADIKEATKPKAKKSAKAE